MGNNECFEPYTSNVYNRRVMAGDFPVINPHLIKDLIAQGLWSQEMKHKIMALDGSVQVRRRKRQRERERERERAYGIPTHAYLLPAHTLRIGAHTLWRSMSPYR
jgi:ribonucleotide reductase alpha subunit